MTIDTKGWTCDQSGLGQLFTLKNLEQLDFTNTIQNMSAEHVAWMGDHWKTLESVEGICNRLGEYKDQPNARCL